jgi:hypothetical protein
VRDPPCAIGPKGPRWGESPGPRSRDRARWDPEPALGLAIRGCGGWERGSGAAIPAEDLAGGRVCPSRAGAWRVRAERWQVADAVVGRSGMEFSAAGFRRERSGGRGVRLK